MAIILTHIDLFAGIGGFAYAVDQVWPGSEHIFCDNDEFCQRVLKKHWPDSRIYGNIKKLTKPKIITDTGGEKLGRVSHIARKKGAQDWICDLLTGGFPCQPFSQAGNRKGTEDNRYLWPQMLRLIRSIHPRWVIAENVGGFVTWNNGMVLEQVCSDLEKAGYEVQAFIIPAVSVNAPHRRDRIWIVAHRESEGLEGRRNAWRRRSGLADKISHVANTECSRSAHWISGSREPQERIARKRGNSYSQPDWGKEWIEVATEFCGVDDGLPVELDGFELSQAGHRIERLKSLGNAIVPQVAIQILEAIKQVESIT